MDSQQYWAKREAEALKHRVTDEAEYDKRIKQIYTGMLDSVQAQIDAFYGRYASREGITLAEAKKRISQLDIEAYERKAKRYVADKDFSKKANEEMRLYNATMKINRLEMLKANIGLEMIAGHEELEKYMEEILQGRTEDELRRQAGILGETVKSNVQKAHAIVNASFHNATFSDRIWMYQDMMKSEVSKLLQTGLIQGKNPRVLARELKKLVETTTYHAERLMRTELARVQTEAQKQSFERNGFEEYTFIVNGGCCDICAGLNGKHFKVADMMPGENAPPMHPHCRCSTAAYDDDDDYEEWLDYLEKGGTTEEWEALKASKIKYTNENSDSQHYRPVAYDKSETVTTSYDGLSCTATKVMGYDNEIYVSDKVGIKPKQLGYVNARINNAASLVGAKSGYKMPRIIICDSTELPTRTVAAYTASNNTLRISSAITSRKGVLGLPKDGACYSNHNSVFVHEMIHWADAQEYIRTHGKAAGYLEANIKTGKKNIDNLANSGYNIYGISEYATLMLHSGRYDEAWAEYRVTQILGD